MFKAFVLFYWGMLLRGVSARDLWQPEWMERDQPDARHFHRRRFTRRYRKRQKVVERVWLVAATLLFFFPSPPLAVGGILFSTFLSFCILDESD